MNADQNRLRELLGEISDGRPIDWEVAVRGLPAADRDRADALREVADIAEFNRLLQRSGGLEHVPPIEANHSGTLENWGQLLLLEQIGRGSHADVYRAWDLELRREVALKLLRTPPDRTAKPEHSPLMAEARAAASVRHPHIVVVHGIAQHQGRVGLWMEFVRGESLEELVRRRGALDLDEVRRTGIEIGSAVQALHRAGVMHRDLKPANVVREENGRWVLTDFGLGSRSVHESGTSSTATGTPMYLAPELFTGAPHTASTEVYALGMMLWTALAGRHPFDAVDLAGLREVVGRGPSHALATLRPDAPPALVAAVERAIAPEARVRWESAAALVGALEALEPDRVATPTSTANPTSTASMTSMASMTSTTSTTDRPLSRTRGRRVLVTCVMLGIALLGFFALRERVMPAVYDVEATLVRHEGSSVRPLVDGDAVAPGDRLSLQVSASRPVWVYVLNEDERGARFLLFPQPSFDLQNPLAADARVALPGSVAGTPSAWTVTSEGGREHFLIVVSPEPVDELQADLASLPAPRADRETHYARVGEASVQRLRGVGGVAPVEVVDPSQSARSLAFDRFRALSGREQDVRGVWVRQIVLQNGTP